MDMVSDNAIPIEKLEKPPLMKRIYQQWNTLSKPIKFAGIFLILLVVLIMPFFITQQTNLFSHAGTSLFNNCTPIPKGLTQQQIQQLSQGGKVRWCTATQAVSTTIVTQAPSQLEDTEVGGNSQISNPSQQPVTPSASSPAQNASIHSVPGSPTPALGKVYHNVMFVGDSITAGWVNDGIHAFPILTIMGLYNHNHGNAWYQLVKGRSGAIAAGTLLDLQAFNIQPKNVNLMIVELGTNDMVHMSASTFQSNYQLLISYLLSGSPNTQLVCLGLWRSTRDNYGYDSVRAYEDVIKNVCKTSTNNTALYVDLSTLYANRGYHNTTADTFHPNNAGAQAIANAIVNAVYPNFPK